MFKQPPKTVKESQIAEKMWKLMGQIKNNQLKKAKGLIFYTIGKVMSFTLRKHTNRCFLNKMSKLILSLLSCQRNQKSKTITKNHKNWIDLYCLESLKLCKAHNQREKSLFIEKKMIQRKSLIIQAWKNKSSLNLFKPMKQSRNNKKRSKRETMSNRSLKLKNR